MDINELIANYIKIREKKSLMKAEFDAKVAKFDEAQEKIEAYLLNFFNKAGIDSIKTPAGTAYASSRSSATVADWDAFFGYVQSNGAYELLEHRANKAAVEEFVAANSGDLPPGINFSTTKTVNFRRG